MKGCWDLRVTIGSSEVNGESAVDSGPVDGERHEFLQ